MNKMNSSNRPLLYSEKFRSLLERILRESQGGLDEMTLKQIAKRQTKIKILKSVNCRAFYFGIRLTPEKNFLTLYFKCLDSKGSGRKHLVRIVLDSFPEYLIKYSDLKKEDIIKKAITDGNSRIHCTCEDFQFRFSFLATKFDYDIVKELRPPNKTNPQQLGSLCKHGSTVVNRCSLFLKSYVLDLEKGNFKKSVRIKTGNKVYVI